MIFIRQVMLGLIATSVMTVLALSSCELEPGISNTGNDSTVVLLISTFRHGLDENIWDMIICHGCEATITEEDMLSLTAPGVPSGYGACAGMLSNREWPIEGNDTYLLTIEYEYGPYLCFDCGHFFGIRTGEASYERMGIEMITTDYGINMVLRDVYCSVSIAGLGYEVIESIHTLSIKFSREYAVIRYDGEEMARIDSGKPCEMFYEAFRVYTYICSSYDENSIRYKLIRLERFRG